MINEQQLSKIRDFAVDMDWNQAFGGKSKGNMHLFRVVKIAKELTEAESDAAIDATIVEAGAWLHDSGLAKDMMGAALCNGEKVETFLKSISVSETDIQRVLSCIESHDGRNSAAIREAMIVHDADTLDKMGPLGILRETWKRSQMGWNTEKIAEHLPKHLDKRKNNLYTDIAKKRASSLDGSLDIFFEVLVNQIKTADDRTSDNI